MCRMFAYVGKSQKDIERLYSSLKKAASHDPTIPPGWKTDARHADGWGCVLLTGKALVHYRTKTAIFDDNSFRMPALQGMTYAIFHARKASGARGSPIFSHPFIAETPREVLFLVHNGDLNESRPNMNRSELVLDKIVKKGSFEKALTELKDITDGAMNLLVLRIDRKTKQAEIKCLNYWIEEGSDAYFQLYSKRLAGGNAVFSSTLNDDLHGKACQSGAIMTLSERPLGETLLQAKP
jgi:predicted glutamine amidotransferase